MQLTFSDEFKPYAKILVSFVTLFLNYIRTTLLLFSSMMIFLLFAMTMIFLQDEVDANMTQGLFLFLEKIPTIQNHMDASGTIHINETTLAKMFLSLSFAFTIATEIVHYFRLYLLKIAPRRVQWRSLKKRLRYMFVALTLMFVCAFGYFAWKTNDFSGGIFIFVLFWILSVASSLLFILTDALLKLIRSPSQSSDA